MKKIFLFISLLAMPIINYAVYLPPVSAKKGMVVTSQRLATQVGVNILKQGGNAVDAAVAVGYALAVVHPCCGNLGGGGFMVIHLANGNNVFINFREKAPKNISLKQFLDSKGKPKSNMVFSYIPVGVPGTVMGLNTALEKYGTMPLKKVIAPAIRLAKQGYRLTKPDIAILNKGTGYFKTQPNVAVIFLKNGKPYQPGEVLKQPELASTLEKISKKGTKAFYQGDIAKAIVKASNKHGGVLTLKDFANYNITISKPLRCTYRGYTYFTSPPPGSGAIVCEILNIVNGYNLKQYGFHSLMATHYNIEAMRYAYADRNHYLADPRFVKIPVKKLTSLAYAQKIRSKIKTNQAGNSKAIGISSREGMNTTHFDVIDGKGNAVSLTYTLNRYFGSKVIAGNTGFFLNDELKDFSFRADSPNSVESNKQPLSSISPTIVMKGKKPFILLGASGGLTIITTVVQTLENIIDFNRPINDAVNLPRYHMQWIPDIVYMEPYAFSKYAQEQLKKMGYTLRLGSPYDGLNWGQMAAILIDQKNKTIYGENDNRRPAGAAIGYQP